MAQWLWDIYCDAMSKRKVTFNEEENAGCSKSFASGDSDHASDDDHDTCFGWDNPFQEGEINDDADMIMILWRQGLLSSYPFLKLTNSDPDASNSSNVDPHIYEVSEAASCKNYHQQTKKNFSTGCDPTRDEKNDFLSSKKIFQTYHKLKKKLMKFNCFVAKQ